MSKDLTNSSVDRQNILNNPYALSEIEKAAGIRGIPFEGKTVVLKEQVAAFFEVTVRTVENYLEQNSEELVRNGYEVLKGKRLQELKLGIQGMDVPETDFGNIAKTPQLGILDFRAFLNLAMLMRESERAGLLRKVILDIVIDTINRRTGGGTKYINQRDEDFIQSAFIEENYRQQFTDALKDCVDMGNFKYAVYTDKIYVSTIHEVTVDKSGGGSLGQLDVGKLESVLQHIQNDLYYPTIDAKLTHLFFCACKFHCFVDGNKRIAISLCVDMLNKNGYLRSLVGFIREAENISFHVAAGNISKELLGEWMTAVLSGTEDDEALKLKIFNAISGAYE